MKIYYSEIFQEKVVILDTEDEKYEGEYVKYSPSEIRKIRQLRGDPMLQTIHNIKRYFEGKIR